MEASMNKAKLTALCAKARGWHREYAPDCVIWAYYDKTLAFVMMGSAYEPIDDADQADALLEYVAFNLGCSWSCGYNILASEYWCEIPTVKGIFIENRRTQNLAKILCALRASPEVTDAEIEEALK
jgi:hypothetical protein